MLTYAEILPKHDVEVPPHLEPMDPIPVLRGLQAQGDVYIRPISRFNLHEMKSANTVAWTGNVEFYSIGKNFATELDEYDVVGPSWLGFSFTQPNRHFLIGDGVACTGWMSAHTGESAQEIVLLKVPNGGEAFLIHTEEHGANGIGPGCYALYQQREIVNGRVTQVAD